MKNIIAIIEKELHNFFVSWLGYIAIIVFLLITGIQFSLTVMQVQEANIRYLFSQMMLPLLLITPVMTMRLLAEENKLGTIELLMTSPVRVTEIILGKYLSCLIVFSLMLVLSLQFPAILFLFGKPDMGPMVSGYFGLFLLGASYISVGLFTSSLTRNQFIAAITGYGIIIFTFILQWAAISAGPKLGPVLLYLSLSYHYTDFAKGIIDTSSVLYYLSFTGIFLFLTQRSLESRRWSA